MRASIFTLALPVLSLMFSCAKEPAPTNPIREGRKISFAVGTENLTRASTGDDFKTTFDAGDAIGIFVVSHPPGSTAPLLASGNYIDNMKMMYDGEKWVIDGEDIYFPDNGDELDFYTCYPYDETADPTAITYNAGADMFDLMTARAVNVSSDPVVLTFKHKLALVEVNIDGAGIGATLKNVIPTATLDLSAGDQNDEISIGQSADAADLALDYVRKGKYRGYLPAQTVAAGNFVSIHTSGTAVPEYAVSEFALNAGSAKKYTLATNIADIDGMPNCYIAAPGGSVTIPVKKAYEVWRQLELLSGLGADLTGELTAELLWMDESGLIASASDIALQKDNSDVENSTIKVTAAAGKSGNAVIAAKIGGVTRWSWHVWVTDYNPDSPAAPDKIFNYDNNDDGVPDYTFMDRNLGATAAGSGDVANVGCYYQWGRKDPFPRPITIPLATSPSSEEQKPAPTTLYSFSGTPVVDKGKSVVESAASMLSSSITTVLELYLNNGTSKDWLSTASELAPDRWKGPNGEKTVFDPCPEGWRVPYFKNEQFPWNNLSGANAARVTKGLEWTEVGIYPLSGRYYAVATGTYTFYGMSVYGYYWTANPYGTNASLLYLDSGTAKSNNDNKTNGFSIRCIKE